MLLKIKVSNSIAVLLISFISIRCIDGFQFSHLTPTTGSKFTHNRIPINRKVDLHESTVPDYDEILQKIDILKQSEVKGTYPVNEEIKAMIANGISPADNFWETTYPNLKKQKLKAIQSNNKEELENVNKNFNSLLELGLKRRSYKEYKGDNEEQNGINVNNVDSVSAATTLLRDVADFTAAHFELSLTKEEQLKEINEKQLRKRNRIISILPQFLHKYIDYLDSLKKPPSNSELFRNMGIGSIFAMITMLNQNIRMASMYSFIGHMAIMSILITRNIPTTASNNNNNLNPSGVNNKITWSNTSIRTGFALCIFFALLSGGSIYPILSLFPVSTSIKLRVSFAGSIVLSSVLSSYYEIYESKTQNGQRWRKAVEGNNIYSNIHSKIHTNMNTKLNHQHQQQEQEEDEQVQHPVYDTYDYSYDPEIDDYPAQPKYLDELDTPGSSTNHTSNIDTENDYKDEKGHEEYEKWLINKQNKHRQPLLETNNTDTNRENISKVLIDSNKIPKWLDNAYHKNVLELSKWKLLKTKIKKNEEKERIQGPMGFRDKKPEWLNKMFGLSIWEEKLLASRAAAREYGAYRKTMWKVDKKIQLKPCDGVEEKKEKNKKESN